MERLVLYKEYSKVITLFELLINSDYTCEEVGNPEYDDSNQIYDTYEVDFGLVKNDLGIDLNRACLYAIYSLIMCNKFNKLDKIYEYTRYSYTVNIEDVKNIGIEKISDFDKFYTEWTNYLESKKNR